ncbi:MAG: hypothetical protein ACKVHE_04715 [Planctomycetales bacterium]|jgi:hypothetical protein
MAKPHLHIDFDPGPWSQPNLTDHRPVGGTISGRVRVTAVELIDCRKFVVTVGWHTEGRGSEDSETIHEVILHEGMIDASETEFPFSCELPDGPISYAGHLINLHWEVRVQLDLAWKVDPKAKRQFYLSLPGQR